MMNKICFPSFLALLLCGLPVYAATDVSEPAPQYLRLSVDKVEIDTAGLVTAAQDLTQSIDALATAIALVADQSNALSAEDRATLIAAAGSVDKASRALAELATRLPETADNMSRQLPQAIEPPSLTRPV